MGRKPKTSSDPAREVATEDAAREASVTDNDSTKPEVPGFKVNGAGGDSAQRQRIGFNLTPDGRIDISALKGGNRERVAEFFRNPGNYAALLPEGSRTKLEVITPEQVKPVWTGLGIINVFLAVKLAKIPAEFAYQIIPYNEKEAELLAQASAEALNENVDKLPAWMLKLLQQGGSLALAKLAMVVYQVHADKLQALKQAIQQAQTGPKVDQPSVN